MINKLDLCAILSFARVETLPILRIVPRGGKKHKLE